MRRDKMDGCEENVSTNLPAPIHPGIHPLLGDDYLFLDGNFGLGKVSKITFV